MRTAPANGTFITAAQTGRTYRVAGDAPFPITSWTGFGGVQPSVIVDVWDVLHPANPLSRLRARPLNGARVEAAVAGTYWLFQSGYRLATPPAAGAVAIDDAGLAAFRLAPPCRVPHLAHLTLAQARTALANAFCGLGSVHHPVVVPRRHVLRVVRQSVIGGHAPRHGVPRHADPRVAHARCACSWGRPHAATRLRCAVPCRARRPQSIRR